MEANELYNLSISPLVTGPFSLKWSEDNHVTLMTHRGVHVFEFMPHPMCIYPTLSFWRTFIYPSEFMPAEIFQQFINATLWKMDRQEIYKLLLQEALTPKIDEKTDIIPRIVRVSWSPIKLVNPSKCLLAIVTSAGSIEILYKLGSDWLSLWNVSNLWSKTVNEESRIDPTKITNDSFHEISLPEHIKRLLGITIDWSSLFYDSDGKPFAYLVAAYRSSDLVITRVESIVDLAKAREPRIIYQTCLKTSVKVNQLFWMSLEGGKSHVIVIGYFDGRIHGLRIAESNGRLGEEKLLKYEDRADRMAVTSITFMKRENGKFVILITKSSCIIAMSLDSSTGECLKKRYLRLEGYSITGLTVMSNDRVMATTQDCRVYLITIKSGDELSHELLKHDMKTSKVQYLGTARSPNGTILLNVTSPDRIYDHLINREPSTLQIFTLTNDEWNPWRLIKEKLESNVPLHDYWDCLETMRINAAKCLEPAKILPTIGENFENLSIHKLRVAMWLTVITQVLDKKQMLKGVDKIVGEISEAQPLIFLLSACKHMERLAKKILLSPDEKRCASFLRVYMEIYMAGEDENEAMSDISRAVSQALEASSHIDSIEAETCNLCGEILSDLPWNVQMCKSGHKLPRCSLTLLQITSVRYRTCNVCGRIFHPSLDDEYEEIRCLYCDVPAQYDSRIVSTSFGDVEKHWKNLSKRPASYQPEPKSNEVENANNLQTALVAINERANKKRSGINNPHTFAVIIDRDHDDDSLITETWQEF